MIPFEVAKFERQNNQLLAQSFAVVAETARQSDALIGGYSERLFPYKPTWSRDIVHKVEVIVGMFEVALIARKA